MLSRPVRTLSEERGQSLILLVLGLTVMFVVGAIVVDVGLWLSERRGSQTDADLSALAGAFELLDPGSTSADAVSAATNSLTANDEQNNADFANLTPAVDNSCWHRSDNDAVTVDVKHDSKALFFGIFGIAPPDIGAHAKACVGAAEAPGNALPFEVSDEPGPCFDNSSQPIFTALCPIEGGAQSPNPRGILDLQASGDYCSDGNGSGDIEQMIEFGASGKCLINRTGGCDPSKNGPWYDCVAVQTGNPKNVLDGTNARISKDGLCDGNDPGTIDDFSESVVLFADTGNPYTSIYAPRDCDPTQDGIQMSPRLVELIILDNYPDPGNTGYPIKAFAGFYIAGCADENVDVQDESDLDPYCGDKLVREITPAAGGAALYVSGVAPGPALAPKTLTVTKLVVGGSAQPSAFTITVNSTGNPVPASFPGSATGTAVLLDAGSSYTVSETGPAGYVPSLSAGCSGNIGNGQTCIITNTFATPAPTPTPSPTPVPGECAPGHCVVYGRFVYIVLAGSAIGPPTDQTTVFGISLVE